MEQHKLYNGKIILDFNPTPKRGESRYSIGGRPIIGVTTFSGLPDKSGPISWWAVNKMCIPYIRENIKPNKKYDEVEIERVLKEAGRQHVKGKEEAADIGTLIHKWCEKYLLGKKPKKPKNPQLKSGVEAFLKWMREYKVELIHTERKVYSKLYDYAGTCDLVAKIDGKLAMIDFKSSNGLYPEYRAQVAAYMQALQEELHYDFKEYWLTRFGKEDGQFEVQCFSAEEFPKDLAMALGLLAATRRLLEIKNQK